MDRPNVSMFFVTYFKEMTKDWLMLVLVPYRGKCICCCIKTIIFGWCTGFKWICYKSTQPLQILNQINWAVVYIRHNDWTRTSVRHAETCWVSLHNYQALDIISWTYYHTIKKILNGKKVFERVPATSHLLVLNWWPPCQPFHLLLNNLGHILLPCRANLH